MVKIYQLTFCVAVVLMIQSCYVKQSSNMSFVNRSLVGRDAEIVSVKMPMFLVKPFLRKELREEDDEMLRLAMRKIKSVKLTTLSNAQNSDRIQENFKDFLRHENMEEYASIISDGDRITINAQTKRDRIRKLMLGVSSEDGEHVFIEVKGNFSMDDIAQAINSYEKKNKE
ncbi:DUF4252 domain-containing protein [Sphingobacterium paludis]|jgi:hypothetical protein|uniref:Uncharacterized protein DUF4252 n=1 Tax=Sphingobacterium paludis TaxID=1476465 RepID=A0A4R7CZA8_9SPHI|nr:DUF4252 domain-containing protein [Sphingobacterium paludis]TDS12505.1 uncharacterized protein DUF4252 [Sphingobacterium paludis]